MLVVGDTYSSDTEFPARSFRVNVCFADLDRWLDLIRREGATLRPSVMHCNGIVIPQVFCSFSNPWLPIRLLW
jgi:hypothetical protein